MGAIVGANFGSGGNANPADSLLALLTGGGANVGADIGNLQTFAAGIPQTVSTNERASTQQVQGANTQQVQGTSTQSSQTMSDTALAALERVVAGQTDPLIALRDSAAGDNIGRLQGVLSGINPEDAASRASGRTAELTRRLLEQVLPGIFGGAERAGTGTNALASLLSQDAAIRTGEAQTRTEEEAMNQAVGQQISGAGILGQLTQGTSAASEQLMQALELARGAVSATTAQTTEATAGTNAATTTASGSEQRATTDPLAWANLLTSMQDQQLGGSSASERAMATFIAAGGDPASLTYRADDYGQSNYNRALYDNILGAMG